MKFDPKQLWTNYLSFVNDLVLKQAHVPVLGLDIGTSAVKAVVLSKNVAGSIEVMAWAVEPIEGTDVKKALSVALGKVKFSDQISVAAVSGKGTLIRYVDLPRMPLEDLRKSFVYDLEKYFPFDPQSIYTDCFILDPKAKGKRMSVLVAAVKKEMIDERVKLFKDVGVELSHVTINSIATANAFERLGPVKSAVSITTSAKAVLDIGGSVSNILVIKDGAPCFTRDIFIGSYEITKQIGNILGVSPEEADHLKQSPGAREQEVKEACEAAVSQLVSEIRLSLDYFMTEKNIQIDEFFLVGGGSLLKGIDAIFEKNIGIAVKQWDVITGLKRNSSNISADIEKYSGQLGVAVGLGLTKI